MPAYEDGPDTQTKEKSLTATCPEIAYGGSPTGARKAGET